MEPGVTERTQPNETWMSAGGRGLSPRRMKNAALRAAAWPLEKTNPLWKPAKTKQSHCFPPSDYFRKDPTGASHAPAAVIFTGREP
jgi:hypothetical protein